MKHAKILIFLFIVTISSANQGFAIKGTDVWNQGGQIIYEYDYIVEWHPNFNLAGFKNYNLADVQYKITYIGIYEENMFFKKDTNSELLIEAIGLGFTNIAEDIVDPETGLDIENDEWAGYFYDASNLEIGMELNDITFPFTYEDSTGSKSINKKFKVQSEETVSMKVDSETNKIVKAWKLNIDDFEIKYTGRVSSALIVFTYVFKNIYWIISQSNGVVLGYSSDISLFADTEQFLKETINITAVESKNVIVDQGRASAIPGFETLVSLGAILTLVVIGFKKKRKLA
jgi:hypothetical protein